MHTFFPASEHVLSMSRHGRIFITTLHAAHCSVVYYNWLRWKWVACAEHESLTALCCRSLACFISQVQRWCHGRAMEVSEASGQGSADVSSSPSSPTDQSSHQSLNLFIWTLFVSTVRGLPGFFQLRNALWSYLSWRVAWQTFIFSVYHRYSEASTVWIQMWSVSVTKTVLKRKLLSLTAVQS